MKSKPKKKTIYITKEELETPKKASEIRLWVDNKIKEISSTAEGRQAIKFGEGRCKELKEEALPLGIFCKKYFHSDEVIITHNVGSQNYDATIEDHRKIRQELKHLEITQAHEGINAHFRMLKLEEDGYVNLLSTVTSQGTRHTNRIIKVENEAIEHSVIFDQEVQRIRDAAERKSGKECPSNTGLIIIVEDYIVFREKAELNNLSQIISDDILPMLENFSKVFIVGWSSEVYLEFK